MADGRNPSMIAKRSRLKARALELIHGLTPLGPFRHDVPTGTFTQEFPYRPPDFTTDGKADWFKQAVCLHERTLFDLNETQWNLLVRGHPALVLACHVGFRTDQPTQGGLLDPQDLVVSSGLDGRIT